MVSTHRRSRPNPDRRLHTCGRCLLVDTVHRGFDVHRCFGRSSDPNRPRVHGRSTDRWVSLDLRTKVALDDRLPPENYSKKALKDWPIRRRGDSTGLTCPQPPPPPDTRICNKLRPVNWSTTTGGENGSRPRDAGEGRPTSLR
jgi:hypothetical protein